MNREKLLDIMRFHEVPTLYRGTGKNGKVTNQDLEDALGDHFYHKKFVEGGKAPTEDGRHMLLRRHVRPMKAYRFNNLKKEQQDMLFEDDNGWVAEVKEDGWRILITHFPGERLHFFGGNLSTTEFLPVDYTYHLPKMYLESKDIFILDTEALCYDTVIQQDGYPSTNTREAVAAILGSGIEVALQAQEEATMIFKCFDIVHRGEAMSLSKRKRILAAMNFLGTNIQRLPHCSTRKKRFLHQVWKDGGEGIIMKNVSAEYDSGGRKRTHAVKVKKSASSLVGDTIDAYISGYIRTDVHSYNDLIGGIELSVHIHDKPVVIATVTNLPDHIRYAFTAIVKGMPVLEYNAYGKVLEIDGQEFSTRNRKLMHAVVVSWDFRHDKSPLDCTMQEADFGGKF